MFGGNDKKICWEFRRGYGEYEDYSKASCIPLRLVFQTYIQDTTAFYVSI